ncbi:uncharacterized protein LOC122510278 [Leptopilina heterotoma]|uniref:uncharacterized protein LOC122510278 n=1 Tax=Leptopilina heterotoma TaxID=63436 RepID=UPI001CA7B960|nr:uncharacterized protein LOC122510278 [Leptopilina heterotoma]
MIYGISSLMMDTYIFFSNRTNISVFMSFVWFSVESATATILLRIFGSRWGQRFSVSIALLFSGMCSLIFILNNSETIKIITGCLGRMSMSYMLLMYVQYVPEFFPTTLRTQGTALIHFLSIVMHFAAPYVIILASIWRELPMIIIAILSLLNSVLILFLPETLGKNLPQTLEDAKMEKLNNDDNEQCLTRGRKKIEDFDDILTHVGDFGKYQFTLMLSLIVFGSGLTTIYFSQIFLTLVPQKHWCKVNELMNFNLTQEERRKLIIPQSKDYPYYDRCNYKIFNYTNISRDNFNSFNWNADKSIKCSQWEYDFNEIPYATISTELNWVCEKEYLIATTQSLFYVGSVFGNFIFGWISDHYGRTRGLLCCTIAAFFASIATAHSHNFWSFAACRFFVGFAYDSIIMIPMIIVLEYVMPMKRSLIGWLAMGVNFTIGALTLM